MLNKDWIKKLEEAKIIRGKDLLINASEIPKLLGKGFESPKEFVENKISGVVPPTTDLMRAGTLMENFIIEYVLENKNLIKYDKDKWQKFEKRLVGNVHGYDVYIGGKPDAFGLRVNILSDGNIIEDYMVIEVKYMPSYKKANINDIPEWYIDQVYSYMYIFKKHAIFAAWLSDYPLIIEKNLNLEVDRMNKFLDDVLVSVDKLLTGKILNEDKKTSFSSNKTFIVKNITQPENELEKTIKELAEIYAKNKVIFDHYKEQEKKIEQLKKKIKQLAENEAEYICGDFKIRILDKVFDKINKERIIAEYGQEFYNNFVEEVKYKEVRIVSDNSSSVF